LKVNNFKKTQRELVLPPIIEEDENGKTNEQLRLSYKLDIYATNPLSRGDIYIEAILPVKLYFIMPFIKHLCEYSYASANSPINLSGLGKGIYF
jgi:bacillolysin